jgi:signal transduction histidine kinase
MKTVTSVRQSVSKAVLLVGLGTLLGCFFASQIFMNAYYSDYDVSWATAFGIAMPQWYVWMVFIPLIVALTRRYPLERRKWPRNLAIHLPTSIAVTVLKLALVAGVSKLITWIPSRDISISYFHTNLFTYWALLGFSHAFDFYRRYRQRELKASQLEARLAQSQLQVLKMQLHPHFLFNTLHAISALIHKDVEAADRMIAQLSDLLRLTLDNEAVHEVTLKQELEFLQSYLEIEQTRFQDRLKIKTEVDPDALDGLVPNLILQPLVENAIRHGIEPRSTPGMVEITAKRDNGRLALKVRDDGPGISGNSERPLSEGIGLTNTRARLQQLYGSSHYFDFVTADQSGFEVSFTIPFNRRDQTSENNANQNGSD